MLMTLCRANLGGARPEVTLCRSPTQGGLFRLSEYAIDKKEEYYRNNNYYTGLQYNNSSLYTYSGVKNMYDPLYN